MKNIIEKIKEISIKHKKVLVIVLLLFLMIGGTVGYVLVKNGSTNSDPKVTQNAHQNINPDTNVTGNKKETKNDKKKEVKEDKKSETNETKTNDVPENTTSNNTSNVTETQNNNVSSNNTYSNTSNNSQPASTPCVPTYTTVNHPEVGHYETQVIRDAWDEPVYEERIVGLVTGRIYNNLDEFDNQDEDGNYSVKMVQVDTIHHEAETQQVWVVDQQAWTETVVSGC